MKKRLSVLAIIIFLIISTVVKAKPCYLVVTKSGIYNPQLISDFAVPLISRFIEKVEPVPQFGVKLDDCQYHVSLTGHENEISLSISGNKINVFGESNGSGIRAVKNAIIVAVLRAKPDKKNEICRIYDCRVRFEKRKKPKSKEEKSKEDELWNLVKNTKDYTELEFFLKTFPDSSQKHLVRVKIHRLKKSAFNRTSEELNKSGRTFDATAWNRKGKATKDFQLKIRFYSKAIEINQDYAEAYYNRGVAYGRSGQIKRALRDLNKSIVINPNSAKAHNSRGFGHWKMGETARAIRDYSQAIKLDSSFANAYGNRGMAYGKLSKKWQAANDFNKYLELEGNKSGKAETVRKWIGKLGYTPRY